MTTPAPSASALHTAANAIRMLAVDAVAAAKSGHQGMPMGMAEIAVALWSKHLRHNPANPHWPNRDRFVVSNGHGSMLPYSLLHLSGYDLSMDDIRKFRQLHSKTPGHPEVGITAGIETTTGPLGQGIANAVGMALAEKLLNKRFGDVIDHRTYVLLGDGCMMEGVSHEACSLAGVWGLNKLVAFYDDNGISIDGEVQGWFRDNTAERFRAYGWHVIGPIDGHSIPAVDAAIETAKKETSKPVLIICKTDIGHGSPNKHGTADAHGTAVMGDEIEATRKNIGWAHAPFVVPAEAYEALDAKASGAEIEAAWNKVFASADPELKRRLAGELPANYADIVKSAVDAAIAVDKEVATRKAAQNALEKFGPALPEMIGGSADLTGSNLTNHKQSVAVDAQGNGNHVSYGVREFGMCAIANGMALHGGVIPYVGTFLVFSDYARNAVRMAALMKQRVLYIFTHDSIGVGEDGPTHQPVEHVASLRLIPGLNVWRPADSLESAVAYASGIERKDGPTMLCLSRQNTAVIARDASHEALIRRGGYIVAETLKPALVLIATGSEVGLALGAQKALAADGIEARVVSMPCTQLFDAQSAEYREAVLPPELPKLAIEAGVTGGWWKYVHGGQTPGAVLGIDTFGESAPAGVLMKHFGFTVENVVAKAKTLV
ncbi:transketolase [Casimicrobium huifangae]|uniref:transketolase n=1 Tax=Casimicrobium huifangae TaxID=2591109 RepID=UPI0012EB28BC|nr:transketolase [Casimicrobium huifangae]